MTDFPEIEMWSTNGPIPDDALAQMIEASNAYALSEFRDPVNEIYAQMLLAVAPFLPQLLQLAVHAKELVAFEAAEDCQECGIGRNPEWEAIEKLVAPR
jgi:hypothetical protein